MSRMLTKFLTNILATSTLAFALVGCGDDAAEKTTAPEPTLSESGSFSLVVDPDSWSPTVGKTSMRLSFEDADGPVDVDQLTVEAFMPMHGHGSTVAAMTMAEAPATWMVHDLVYTMAGAWEVNVTAEIDGTDELFIIPVEVR